MPVVNKQHMQLSLLYTVYTVIVGFETCWLLLLWTYVWNF